MKKVNVVLITMLIGIYALVFTSLGFAGAKGNARKGRYLFRQNCLSCHSKSAAEKGVGKIVQPSSKTQEEWKITFGEENYKKVKCINNWDKLSAEDINDLYLFLYEHASDSPTPVDCSAS